MAAFGSASTAQSKPLIRMKELFFDRKKVTNALDKSARRNLSKVGAFIRNSARRSIVKARRKNESELTKRERRSLKIRFKVRNIKKVPRSAFPFASAAPGSPPRVPGLLGGSLLRKFLFFAYEARRRSVVIGPARVSGASGTAPKALEEGGRSSGKTQVPHPYMGPALKANLAVVRDVWRNSIKP